MVSLHDTAHMSQQQPLEQCLSGPVQLNDLGEEEIAKKKKQLVYRWSFWWYFAPALASAALVLTAIVLRVLHAGEASTNSDNAMKTNARSCLGKADKMTQPTMLAVGDDT